jgi:hypothetical protein
MISDAYGPPPGCTCQDSLFTSSERCPYHGKLPGAKPLGPDRPKGLDRSLEMKLEMAKLAALAPAENADYARGRAAGFREGLELALKFMMALGAR